ncbi:glycerol-3-phosphate dehydrogenase/oxidase [Rhodospirillaceae bacterium KN72]|uniref:Glycerol-3-phosphate dehydrogenase/oxidase n=1 Tax=Pacificispira spongiicola TaxID=2729598 RepID=A0A7Y0DXH7_9PROT|nr:glycerol-3-phosphate dehydrogenase/oxidase [Pacificispira spongiicola]NMM43420.1 glycerol-3-phosphate dehydrogenase/oxidase [Pacificispira spongiicola]
MPDQRDDNLNKVRNAGHVDVIVVGGGINGIGVFRDLALQGVSVLLVDRADFCSGCSAAPSRMIHGGLRYLENGEFGLVRESLRERDALLVNAPHMVRPLPTTIPITSLFSGMLNAAVGFIGGKSQPAQRGALPVKIGLSLYDWVTRDRRLTPKHVFRNAAETAATWPGLKGGLSGTLRWSATYFDAWISHPERLGVELILDAQRDAPDAIALNHADIVRVGDGFAVTDLLTGERIRIGTSLVVNATGAWLDETNRALAGAGLPTEPFVSGTKGSHLIIDKPALRDALNGHMIFFENSDGRICIVFPYLGNVLAGSTDIRVDKVTRVRCETEERDYILESLRLIFPEIEVTPDDVVFSYSGIRPLPRSDHDFTGRISRGHSVERLDGNPPQLCMIGGKWTTFRAFAEEATTEALKCLGRPRVRDTLSLRIGGGAGYPEDPDTFISDLSADHDLSKDRAAYLFDLYGTRARDVAAFCASYPGDKALDEDCSMTTGEVAFLLRQEFAVTLGDIVLRRTALAIRGEISARRLDRIAEIVAAERGWDDARRDQEMQKLVAELDAYYGVSPAMLENRDRRRE